ncbi:MAG TPA: hypothetical protein VMV68_03120 [Spirochaetia bacterium]|nr:hypothetical protein [Spirochaetia bacterium]
MKGPVSTNILRLGLVLFLVGFLLPIACNLNGYQIAQGILGHQQHAQNAVLLASVADSYGYLVIGSFAIAFLGLALTVLFRGALGCNLGSLCFAVSLLFLVLVALKFHAMQNTAAMRFLISTFSITVKMQAGGYSMATGYSAGVVGFALRVTRTIQ